MGNKLPTELMNEKDHSELLTELMSEHDHVDEFIERCVYQFEDEGLHYASFFLFIKRLDAIHQMAYSKIMEEAGIRLFCTYKGEQFRVTGASRLGDVWLNRNFSALHGYDLRVKPSECTNWRKSPEVPNG